MIELPGSVREELIETARRSAPEEACGVLAGERGRERSRVEAAVATDNAADDPRTRYRIDPVELHATIDRVEERGLEVVGFYHSHPRGPPEPSGTDVERAEWRGYSYVIVALEGEPVVRSWRWAGETFEREQVADPGADGRDAETR